MVLSMFSSASLSSSSEMAPVRSTLPRWPRTSTIVEDAESLNAPAVQASVYSFALLLLCSSLFLSIAAWLAKQPMKKYGIRV